MLTALLGFLSLLFVPATPLASTGTVRSDGDCDRFRIRLCHLPFFLRIQTPKLPRARRRRSTSQRTIHHFFKNKHGRIVASILLAAAVASIGILKLDTEPSLFSYFKKGSELRNSLEYIDENGGSIPLNIVLANPEQDSFEDRGGLPATVAPSEHPGT